MKRVLGLISVLALLGLLLAHCGGEEEAIKPAKTKRPAPKKAAATAETAKETALAETTEQAEPKLTTLMVSELRDPFRSYFTDMLLGRTTLREIEGAEARSPLQQYEVDQFVVQGIIFGVTTPTAIVADPTGQTHLVKIGTIIGKNWGKVIKIKRDGIVVHEEFVDPSTGQRQSREVFLVLRASSLKPWSGVETEEEGKEGAAQTQGTGKAASVEEDRLKRFEEILNTTEVYKKFWQSTTPPPSAVPGGIPSAPGGL